LKPFQLGGATNGASKEHDDRRHAQSAVIKRITLFFIY
jgi:hypothetical protein